MRPILVILIVIWTSSIFGQHTNPASGGNATGSGGTVYVETQTPTTNINGLVTIEIGGGTPVTGTSQILSVPYAYFSRSSGTSADAVKITGDQPISGIKTFTETIQADNNVISGVGLPDCSSKLLFINNLCITGIIL
jgi:hypothetical protein